MYASKKSNVVRFTAFTKNNQDGAEGVLFLHFHFLLPPILCSGIKSFFRGLLGFYS